MRFSELLRSAGIAVRSVRGDADVTSVTADSRRAGAGACFVAIRGSGDDGHRYIQPAVAAGCAAVVCEDPAFVPDGLPHAVAASTRVAVGALAQAIRGWPSRRLVNVGVTGTNGKSTTVFLLRDILAAAGHSAALLGTISYHTGGRTVDAAQTTPDPVALADLMAEMVAAGRTHLVMEVSSHALDQDRTAGVEFRVGVFTNLTGDHLDYHKSMEQYLAAKRRLFEQLPPEAFAVINRDDPSAEELAKATRASITWYGLSEAADLRARIERVEPTGTGFEIIHAGRGADSAASARVAVHLPLIGRHNVYNALAAAGAALALGVELPRIGEVLGRAHIVPGRLERVDSPAPYQVFVDYAHTDDALTNVLSAVRPVTRGRLMLVFGCGGDRDRTKRPRMARVAETLADVIFVTSDNPRTEDPRAILDEIVAGFSEQGRARATVEPDRRRAISLAVEAAREGDVVVIAGKGHEKYQVVGKQRTHFDDVEEAATAMRRASAGGANPGVQS